MNKNLQMVVGLGNAGEKYKHTRHNAGFDIVDAIAEAYSVNINKNKFDTLYGKDKIENIDVILVKPMMFMNLSGLPVLKLSKYYNVDTENIIVVHDDIDISFGKLKIKKKGGDGGHKGIRSIIDTLGTDDFIRVRFGVGRPLKERISVSQHVLGAYHCEEKDSIIRLINDAKDAVILTLLKGFTESMNCFNRR